MPQTSAQKHYQLHKKEISAKNASHQAARRYAEANGLMTRSQAACYLDITTQQLTNIESSIRNIGNVWGLLDLNHSFYTIESIEAWKLANKEYFANIKKLSGPEPLWTMPMLEMIINFMRDNAELSIITAKYRKAQELKSLESRYAL
jgi:hypothetical protein